MSGQARGIAVVTGGATGIGFATVERLASSGWRVAFFNEREQSVAEARDRLKSRGLLGATHSDVVDLRDHDAVNAFFGDTARRLGAVTALVSNAAFVPPKRPDGRVPLAEVTQAEWQDVLAVNLTGALVCVQCVLPGMVANGHGRIVLVGSVAGRTTSTVAGVSYIASKSALAGLARSIVGEYSKHGITANTVCPGRVLTPMTGAPDSPANIAAARLIPAGRLGQPDDIARVIDMLVQPESGFINGAIIDVNGGEFAPS